MPDTMVPELAEELVAADGGAAAVVVVPPVMALAVPVPF